MTVHGSDALFLHIRHSGGTSVAHALETAGLGQHIGTVGYRPHTPAHELPSEWFVGCRVWATVRDPWSWHVSRYHACIDTQHTPNEYMAALVGPEPISFGDYLAIALARGHSYTYEIERMASGQRVEFVDLPVLPEGLEAVYGRPVDVGRLNTTGPQAGHRPRPAHGPVADHYTEDLDDLIRRYEAPIIERFGYTGPGSAATRGVIQCESN